MKILKNLVVFSVCLMLVFGMGVMLAGCGSSKSEGATSITNLTYNGETISWSSVKNAKNYKIKINDREYIVSQASGTVTYNYNANGEDFDFYVEAVIKDGSDKNPTYTIQFKYLGQVTGLNIEDGNLTWDVLEGAEKYEIMYNGNLVSDLVGTNSYKATAGDFSYKVRATKGQAESTDGNLAYYSVWSDALTGKILAAPKNLTYDSETFAWDKVTGATAYVIKIGNNEFTTTTNSYAYVAGNSDFNVSVCAVGNKNEKIYDSAYSQEKTYKYIAPVEGLNVVDGKLVWSHSENAVRYKIKINGTDETELLTTNEYAKLNSGNSYRIQILPIGSGDFWFSQWSNEITINILRSPVVSFGDNVIKWNQVVGCAGYAIKIEKDNEVVFSTTTGAETFTYNYAFEKAGDYLVYVKATALENDSGLYESKYSTAYPVKRLAAPTNKQVINRPLEQNQLSVNFTPAVGATGYALFANDVQIASINSGATFNIDLKDMTSNVEESVINFKIVAKGGVTTDKAVLDSLTPLEFNATRLAVPQNLMINGNQLSWTPVNSTSKYVLTIDGKRTEITTTAYTLTDMSAGAHTIYVQAMGNGEQIITSGFSNALDVQKLATPTNLNITNGNLTWNSIPGATGYKVILGTQSFDADTTAFNLSGYLSSVNEGMGTQISVFAKGNGSNVIDSDVSATRTISRYARPSAIKVNAGSLIWNASSVNSINCNSYKLYISKDGAAETEVSVTGTSYAMSNFTGGNYSVVIVAVGDNEQTLDSPRTAAFTFTKLAQITTVTNDGKAYTWEAVAGAVNYEIKLSKDATWTVVNTNSYTPTFNTEGQFEVSIRAMGNNIDVITSEVYSFTQQVSRITQPVRNDDLTNANSFKVEKTGNTITVTVKKQDLAAGYKFFVGGIDRTAGNVSESGEYVTFTYTMTTSGADYKLQVQIVGGVFASNGTYMLDSNMSTEVTVTNN